MKLPLRAASVIAVALVACCGFVLVCRQAACLHGVDIRNYLEEEKNLDESAGRGDELNRADQRVLLRMSRKNLVIRELIAGRITLSDASEEFMTLNREYPELTTATRFEYPSGSDEESSAMQVLAHARIFAKSVAAAPADAVTRLEKELKNMRESRSKSLNDTTQSPACAVEHD